MNTSSQPGFARVLVLLIAFPLLLEVLLPSGEYASCILPADKVRPPVYSVRNSYRRGTKEERTGNSKLTISIRHSVPNSDLNITVRNQTLTPA